MACVVVTLPSSQVLTFTVPNGGQVVTVAIRECKCGCKQWFVPMESTQLYLNPDHQQQSANDRRPRKTERRTS